MVIWRPPAPRRGGRDGLLEAEAQIPQVSVHAALGEYDTAAPMLRSEVERLGRVSGAEELLRDARAELEAYENLAGR